MRYSVINMDHYPLLEGESWHVVEPNNGECTFSISEGSMTICHSDFREFRSGTLYVVTSQGSGWVTVACHDEVLKMPEYVFARYFDAETYVKNKNISQQPQQLLLFED